MCTIVRDAGTNPGSPMWWRASLWSTLRDEAGELFVAGAAAHQRRQIVLEYREQAGADLAVGGQAHAAAVSAEGHAIPGR